MEMNNPNSNITMDHSKFTEDLSSNDDNMIMNMRRELSNSKREAAIDELQVMLYQESTKYLNNFVYLSTSNNANNDRVGEGWRRKICEWAFEVVDHFGFDREVVSIAVNFLDRVATLHLQEKSGHRISLNNDEREQPPQLNRREFQLIAVTCLYMAIKMHGENDAVDGPRRKLRIEAFVDLSRGLFTIQNLEAKEFEILKMLKWNVNPPSTVRLIATLLKLLPSWSMQEISQEHSNIANALYEMARYLSELAVCVSTFSFKYKTSEVAFACILCAFDAIQRNSKVQIPFGIEEQFIENISFWSNNNLTIENAAPIQQLLMELCPAMFPTRKEKNLENEEQNLINDDDESSSARRNDSPVSVMNASNHFR